MKCPKFVRDADTGSIYQCAPCGPARASLTLVQAGDGEITPALSRWDGLDVLIEFLNIETDFQVVSRTIEGTWASAGFTVESLPEAR